MRGKEFVEYENPFDVGMTGLLGFSSGYSAMMSCDLLLSLGRTSHISSSSLKMRPLCRSTYAVSNLDGRTNVDLALSARRSRHFAPCCHS